MNAPYRDTSARAILGPMNGHVGKPITDQPVRVTDPLLDGWREDRSPWPHRTVTRDKLDPACIHVLEWTDDNRYRLSISWERK